MEKKVITRPYIVVVEEKIKDLETKVAKLMNEGYVPTGGIQIGDSAFCQAMVIRLTP